MGRALADKKNVRIRFAKASDNLNWGHVVRNTAIAVGITFVTAVGVYLAIRLFVSVL